LAAQALDVEHQYKFGIFAAGMSVLSILVVSLYWWRTYRSRGLEARPRISFREIYVLYFGMSVEVGMIVNCITSPNDIALAVFSILLPPILIAVVALMDDTPNSRNVGSASIRGERAPQISDSGPPSGGSGTGKIKRKKRKLAHTHTRSKKSIERTERRIAHLRAMIDASRGRAQTHDERGWRIIASPNSSANSEAAEKEAETVEARWATPAASNETFAGRSASALQAAVLALLAKPRRA
jgi:hypothetical protein